MRINMYGHFLNLRFWHLVQYFVKLSFLLTSFEILSSLKFIMELRFVHNKSLCYRLCKHLCYFIRKLLWFFLLSRNLFKAIINIRDIHLDVCLRYCFKFVTNISLFLGNINKFWWYNMWLLTNIAII